MRELDTLWHYSTLEKIFIENRIYRLIEEEKTWDGVLNSIKNGLKPHLSLLKNQIIEDDIIKLTEIKIKRISKFDLEKADRKIKQIEDDISLVKLNLENLNDFAIQYFKNLKSTYAKGKERKTEIRIFDDVDVKKVVVKNSKLYINREEGFIGTSLRKDEFIEECSDIDDVIVFTQNGDMKVSRIQSKKFVAKNILYASVFKKKDTRTIYNMIYKDGKTGVSYIKRFNVTGVTRDKLYNLTSNHPKSKVLHFSANPNGEGEVVTIQLRQNGSIKKLKWDLDFADLTIKGRSVKGNIVSKHAINKVVFKEKGLSTLKPRKIWFDDTVQRLNVDDRGDLLGEFKPDDDLLIVQQSGNLKVVPPDLTMHFPEDMIILEKADRSKPITVAYYNKSKKKYFVKRFILGLLKGNQSFVNDAKNDTVEIISTDWKPLIEVVTKNKKLIDKHTVNLFDFISVKGIKAIGNQLTNKDVKEINILDSIPYEPETVELNEIEVIDAVDNNDGEINSESENDNTENNQIELDF